MAACRTCGEANRDGARFCAACGASLRAPCPQCTNPLPDGARFCDACGYALEAGARQARKVVTILFADLSGSTRAQEQMDPESVRRFMDRYYVAMRTEIERRGGRVVKFIGDGVMAAFGVPDVREDDARRALEAAVAMHEAFGRLTDDPALGLRIGINTGEVIVTDDDDDVVGDAVNVAARLEGAAAPGDIVVGESTFRLVRLTARLQAMTPLSLKGKADPVPAFRLVALDPVRDLGASTAFVGRDRELGRLAFLLDEAIKHREARRATIVGSPGVGKTRLARELAGAATAQARVVELRCDPTTSTFAPIAEALRQAAAFEEDADDATIVAAFRALFEEDNPDRERVATVASALFGVGEPGSPEETFWAVRRLVENSARRRPMVLFIDDVHWAEPLLLDLIENLVEWIRDQPVLLVLTARPELRELRPTLVEDTGRGTVLHLEGLDQHESRRLACEVLGTEWLPDALFDRIVASSEGNPLFVGELLRMLVDDGVLQREGDEWVATVDLAEVDVPLTIHALLTARIDRLDPDERTVLEAASVLGKTFYRGAVAAVLPPDVRANLDPILERLRRKELVEPAGTYWIDEPVSRFHHVLIRDAAYRRLLKDARADLHERVAGWLEAKVGDLVEHDDVIGYQLEQAFRLRAELGTAVPAVGARASVRLANAGRRALDADDSSAAGPLLLRALDCAPDGTDVGALLVDACEALVSAGDLAAAVPTVERLEAEAGDDERLAGWVACFQAEVANLTSTGSLEVSAARAADAAAALAALGDVAGEAKAHAVHADALARLGRIGDCEAALDRALGAARRAGDRRRATAVLAGAPLAALWGPNPVTRASGRCLDVVRVLRITTRAPAVEATSLRCQAILESLRGRAGAGRRMLAGARAALEELGNRPGLLQLDVAEGIVSSLAGDLDDAEMHLAHARDGLLDLGLDADAAFAAALLAEVLVAKGDVDEAVGLTRQSERLGGDDLRTAIAWRAVRAVALVARGETDEAVRIAGEAVALAETTDALIDHAKALAALARALGAAGDSVAARARAVEARDLYERKEASLLVAAMDDLLGGALATDAAPAEHVVEWHPENACSRKEAECRRCLMEGDFTGLADTYTPDVGLYDMRPMMLSEVVGRAEYVDHSRLIVELGMTRMDADDLAVRGEHLVLTHLTWGDDAGEYVVGAYGVGVADPDDDYRVRANYVYDLTQFAEALAALEARFVESLPPDQAAIWGPVADFMVAINARTDPTSLGDDLVVHDHRPMGWGVVDAAGFAGLCAETLTRSPDMEFFARAIHGFSGDRVLCRAEGRGTTQDGGEYRTSADIVFTVRDGHIRRSEYFVTGESAALDCLVGAGPHPLENDATRMVAYVLPVLLEGDAAALADEVIGSSYTVEDRRPLVGMEASGIAGALAMTRSVQEIGVERLEHQAVAIRGSSLCLCLLEFSGPASGVSTACVAELTPSGYLGGAVVFEPTQLDDAFALLDERYWATLPAADAETLAVGARLATAMNDGDVEAVRACFTPAARVVDHRPLSVVEIDREQFVTAFQTVVDAASDARWRILDVLACEAPFSITLNQEHGTRDGGEFADNYFVVSGAVDGCRDRLELFGLGDEDAAWARYHELVGSALPTVANAASTAALAAIGPIMEGDWATVATLVAPEFSIDDRRPLVGGRWDDGGEMLAATAEVAAADVDHWDARPIAVRGDRFALVELLAVGDLATTPIVAVYETDAERRVRRATLFEPEQADDAFALLDEGYWDTLRAQEAGTLRLGARLTAAMDGRDADAVRACLTDDATITDHRPMAGITFDREQFVDVYRMVADASPDARWRQLDVVAVSPGCALTLNAELGTRDGGAFESRYYVVARVREDRGELLEVFPEDGLAAATARYEELLTSGATLRNAATDSLARVIDLCLAGEWDLVRDGVEPGCTYEDRRSIVGGGAHGIDQFIADAQGVVEAGPRTIDLEVAAVRGRDLAVLAGDFRGDVGAVRVTFVAEAAPDGRLRRAVVFEPGHLDDAFALLGEWYGSTLPPEVAEIVRLGEQLQSLMNAGDLVGLRASVTDDFVVEDHRALSLGVGTIDDLAVTIGSLLHESPDARYRWAEILAVEPSVLLARTVVSGTRQGGAFASSFNSVLRRRGGAFDRLDLFSTDDLAAAQACFERSESLSNRAAELAHRFHSPVLAGDLSTYVAWVADDFVFADARPLVGGWGVEGPDALIDMTDGLLAVGVRGAEMRTLAVRGPDLCLMEALATGDAGSLAVLLTLELDRDGRMTREVMWAPEQLEAAVAQLDERFAATLPADDAATFSAAMRSNAALNRHDAAGLRSTFQPDASIVDHRPLSFGRMAVDQWVGSVEAAVAEAPDVRWTIVDVPATSPAAALLRAAVSGERAGGRFAFDVLIIALRHGDRLGGMEFFDGDDLAAARRRFEQLEAPDGLRNAAFRAGEAMMDHLFGGHVDRIAPMLAEDLVNVDHRQTIGSGLVIAGRAANVEAFEALLAIGTNRYAATPVAARGDRLALVVGEYGSPGTAVFILTLVELDADGLLSAFDLFDPENEDAAFALLEARFLEQQAGRAARVHDGLLRAILTGDDDTHRALLAADVIAVDHRPLVGQTYRGRAAVMAASDGVIQLGVVAIPRRTIAAAGDRAVLSSVGFETAEGAALEVLQIMAVDDGGLIVRNDVFDLAQRPLAEETLAGRGRTANAATAAYDRFGSALLAFDAAAMAEEYAEDIVITDDRPVIGGRVTAEGRAAAIEDAASLQEVLRSPSTVMRWEHLEIRGNRVCRTRLTFEGAGMEVRVINVIGTDDDGRMVRNFTFEEHQEDAIAAAVEELLDR